jgi:3',5'-cyclic AMP phosphodiesterase CpdA
MAQIVFAIIAASITHFSRKIPPLFVHRIAFHHPTTRNCNGIDSVRLMSTFSDDDRQSSARVMLGNVLGPAITAKASSSNCSLKKKRLVLIGGGHAHVQGMKS